MEYTKGTCPNCKQKISFYKEGKILYGNPIRTCPKCTEKYIDLRYHELAVEENNEKFSVKEQAKKTGKAFVGSLLLFVFNFIMYVWDGSYFSFFWIVGFFGIGAFLLDFLNLIRKIVAKKSSVQRLKDRYYAKELESVGYEVPKEYLM